MKALLCRSHSFLNMCLLYSSVSPGLTVVLPALTVPALLSGSKCSFVPSWLYVPDGSPYSWALSHNPARISLMCHVVYLPFSLLCCSQTLPTGPCGMIVSICGHVFPSSVWDTLTISLPPRSFYRLDFFLHLSFSLFGDEKQRYDGGGSDWSQSAPFSPLASFFAVSLFSDLALWFMGSLWWEATGDPVWLQNTSEIRQFVVPHRDHRQILRFAASFMRAQTHRHTDTHTHTHNAYI